MGVLVYLQNSSGIFQIHDVGQELYCDRTVSGAYGSCYNSRHSLGTLKDKKKNFALNTSTVFMATHKYSFLG